MERTKNCNDNKNVIIDNMDPLQLQAAEEKNKKKECSRSARSSRRLSSAMNNNFPFTNMAEARREVALALQLHRSTYSSSSSSAHHHHHAPPYPATASASCRTKDEFSPSTTTTTAYCCYSAVDTLPIPGPVWSTTSPAVLAQPPPLLAPLVVASPATTGSTPPESQHHEQAPQFEYCYNGGDQSSYYIDQTVLGPSNYSLNCFYNQAAAAAAAAAAVGHGNNIPDWWMTTASNEVSNYFDQCYSAAELSSAGRGGCSTMEEKRPGM